MLQLIQWVAIVGLMWWIWSVDQQHPPRYLLQEIAEMKAIMVQTGIRQETELRERVARLEKRLEELP
jgi:hypothetical protein